MFRAPLPGFRFHADGRRRPAAHAAFTLIELLVVIAIIGVLASVLLPALSQGKRRAQKTACAGLLKQYAMATDLYAMDWQDYYPDVQAYLKKESGFLGYFGNDMLPQQAARCPGDASTERLGRLGDCNQDGVAVKVSIGVNGNNISDTLCVRSTGTVAYWVKHQPIDKASPSKISMWMDYQFQPASGGDRADHRRRHEKRSPYLPEQVCVPP